MSSDAYAFVGWLSIIAAYVIFLMWVLIPDKTLHSFGIVYYPSRYYAVALPAYFIFLLIMSGIFYVGLNMFITFDASDLRTVEDSNSMPLQSANPESTIPANKSKQISMGVPDIGDMDPCEISELSLELSLIHKTRVHKKFPKRSK